MQRVVIFEIDWREIMKVAPWKDYKGDDIVEGCIISHPSGQQGTVLYKPERDDKTDQWVVNYGHGIESRLCLQVGDKGKAIRI